MQWLPGESQLFLKLFQQIIDQEYIQAFFYQRRAYQDLYRDNIPWGFWSLEQHESNVAVNQDPCAALSIEELTHYRLCDGATGYISASTMQG